MSALYLGVDLGSSGLRLAVLADAGEPGGEPDDPVLGLQAPYPGRFEDPEAWRQGLIHLLAAVPEEIRRRVRALAVDGTSGTLLACGPGGSLLPPPLADALPYHQACPEQAGAIATLLAPEPSAWAAHPAASSSGSLARALRLMSLAKEAGLAQGLLLRHQADWLMGWLLDDWRWGEEGNNVRLGWDLPQGRWLAGVAEGLDANLLPAIRSSGSRLGRLAAEAAASLGLPADCQVVAGSTDANAAVLAADPQEGDGIAVLGTTLVLKQFVAAPLAGAGLSNHRVGGRWLVGGASNAGAGILRRFFDDAQIAELSRQITPDRPTGLALRPLSRRGERFPVDDPELEPILEPRPTSDARYLQALLEGLTAIEVAGWRRLWELGAPALRRVISLGGGARNSQWRALRTRALGIPVLNRPKRTAALGMALLARASSRMGADSPSPRP
ncbi:FGGY-family carbohydrate kinase [Cyanobium gracile]|uniref:Pentulose/hexulose kinase n=1 Tax=Cyanobium gracile (strain ATCC 27147 / PCC 6307) TaxID=292564 RepID=K9P6N6_CYAGP|nr:FGGY-family carbohydrate kinase [Cyanobium gracile]AFY28780.1 pentulose/hexulose kinase [Cyanobium gracile PCC 6307]